MARFVTDSASGLVWALDGGMSEVLAKKQAYFEHVSGQRRTPDDLDLIADAAYAVRDDYESAEDLYRQWACASVPVERIRLYMGSEMPVMEALTEWEPRFKMAESPGSSAVEASQTTAALEALIALRAPAHARLGR